MKRMLLILALAFGCGGGSETPSEDTTTDSAGDETTVVEETEAPAEQTEGSSAEALAADFDQLCRAATGAAESAEPDRRRMAYAMAVANVLQTEEARNAFQTANAAADDQKQATFAAAAAEVGIEGWECPDLELIYGSQR